MGVLRSTSGGFGGADRSWILRRKDALQRTLSRRKEWITGWALVTPWVFGFLAFTLGPMLASLGLSFTEWSIFSKAKWIGLENYNVMLTKDPLVWQALKVTIFYSVTAVPLQIAAGLSIAILLNQKIRGLAVFRTIFYLPTAMSGVAIAMVWLWVFSGDFGLINSALKAVGINGPYWLSDQRTVLPAFVIMSLWTVGGGVVIYLAGLQGIPTELYEAADVDGAGDCSKFRNITLPINNISFPKFNKAHMLKNII